MSNTIEADIRRFGLGPGSRFGHVTALHFDAGMSHVFMALCSGAVLYLLPNSPDFLDVHFTAVLKEEAITHSILPVGMLATLPGEDVPRLEVLGVGAEACPVELVERWGRGRRFFNLYGPTETTITATAAECVPDGRTPPIGRPIANLQVYILDRYGRPTPIGVPGEVYIGGVGVARGYHAAPGAHRREVRSQPVRRGAALSHRRFGAVVALDDGAPTIEFLGRVDDQVKIRGFRVEPGEIEGALRAIPHVKDAFVTVVDGATGDGARGDSKSLVAYITPMEAPDPERCRAEHLEYWQRLHAEGALTAVATDLTFDITGWNSSYDREELPAAEMREWVKSAADRVLALRPRDVLEIGAGRGLVLARIAPEVDRYWATDISPYVVEQIRKMKETTGALKNVTPLQRAADDFDGFTPGQFDTIILNSTIQYFPSIDYLLAVLSGALRIIKPGGAIFVGDVRSLPLLEAFHASVELFRAAASLPMTTLRDRVRCAVLYENELIIDPGFFTALGAAFPQISRVEVSPKRGRYCNELSRFRYDVTLQIGGEPVPAADVEWHDWRSEGMTLGAMTDLLRSGPPRPLGIRGIPNARVQAEVTLVQCLRNGGPGTVGRWRSEEAARDRGGCDPEDVFSIEKEFPYRIHLSWAGGRPDGSFDAVMIPRCLPPSVVPPWEPGARGGTWSRFATDPLLATHLLKLGPRVREELRARVPSYMIPSVIMALPALPRTSVGKVDRRALPVPSFYAVGRRAKNSASPRTGVAKKLAAVWGGILGIENVGVNDNFFDLGGDSILSLQIVARAREHGIMVTAGQLFQHQTIAELSTVRGSIRLPRPNRGRLPGPSR